MPIREDNFVYPLMIELIACLCTEIEESGLPMPCQCALMPGPDAILDYCGACSETGCGGQAWVRLAGAYPSRQFPAIDETSIACDSPIAYQVEVGIVRCTPVGTANIAGGYEPPSLEEQVEAVRIQMADMSAMRRAVACCLETKYVDLTYTLGAYTPLGGGDCNGGIWLINVWSAT